MQPNQFNSGMRKSGRGVIALVLGILSLVGFGALTGIPAWIVGGKTLDDIREGIEDPSEFGLAQTGRILGMISTGLTAIGFIFVVLMFSVILGPMTRGMSDMGSPVESTISRNMDAKTRREAILQSATEERMRSPKKDYGVLAKELSRGHVAWYTDSLEPPQDCGKFTFSGKNGRLEVKDGCGTSSLEGWPPANMSRANRD